MRSTGRTPRRTRRLQKAIEGARLARALPSLHSPAVDDLSAVGHYIVNRAPLMSRSGPHLRSLPRRLLPRRLRPRCRGDPHSHCRGHPHSNCTEVPPPADRVCAQALATDYLVSRQDSGGWWKGELRTNVTMDAEDLLLRQFLNILTDDDLQPAARWIRSQQREDGTWATFYDGPGDLSTTIEAYLALKLAGDDITAPHMRSAASEFVLRPAAGSPPARVFTRMWLALFGELVVGRATWRCRRS